jgi:hypothetical protein
MRGVHAMLLLKRVDALTFLNRTRRHHITQALVVQAMSCDRLVTWPPSEEQVGTYGHR